MGEGVRWRYFEVLCGVFLLSFLLPPTAFSAQQSKKETVSGMLFYSSGGGGDIIRYSFKNKKKEVLISRKNGSYFYYPNYSASRNKIFVVEEIFVKSDSYLCVSDIDGSNLQRIKKLSSRGASSLSLSGWGTRRLF